MASAKDIWVAQSPQAMAVVGSGGGEAQAQTLATLIPDPGDLSDYPLTVPER